MKKIILVLLAAVCILAFAGCEKKVSDEAISLARYLQLFEDPSVVDIQKLDKYEFNDNIDIYDFELTFIDEYGEKAETKMLIKHVKKSPIATLCFWNDMNANKEAHAEVKALWETRNTDALSFTSFTGDEIEKAKEEAIAYLEEVKAKREEQ